MNASQITGALSAHGRQPFAGIALGRCMQRLWRCGASVAVGIAGLVLQACGGGTTSDVSPQPPLNLPTLSGHVSNGAGDTDLTRLQVTVKGTAGTARTTAPPIVQVNGQDYSASIDKLTGPYLLSSVELGLVSVATARGTANITPLTTLLVAQLLGTDPNDYFASVTAQENNGLAVDSAVLQAADQRVRRYLQREVGFTVPATLGNFVTTPFNRVPGDPMHDAITALTARVGNNGDYRALVAAFAQEAGRCKAESLNIVSGGVTDEFCPFSKTNEFEEADSTVQAIGFVNRRGDTLTVRVRGSDVLTTQWRTAEGASFECSGAGCAGLSLGTPAADRTRPLAFTAVSLSGTQGTARLDGTLTASVPGIALPGLPCNANRYYLIAPDRTATGYCAGPDDSGLGQGGTASPSGATQLTYLFQPLTDQPNYPFMRVVVDGDVVRSVALINTDGVTAPYVCVGDGCVGVTLGAVRVDNSAGVELRLRSFTFSDVVLRAVQPDGALSASDTLTLRAALVGAYAPQPGMTTVACASPSQSVSVQTSDSTVPTVVCVPADTMGFTLSGSYIDGDGNTGFFVQSLLTDGNGSFSSGDSVTVLTAADGSVVSVSYSDRYGVSYGCTGTACTGVTVSAPNGAGERTVSLAGTPLREADQIAVLGNRTATATGSFVAPPP